MNFKNKLISLSISKQLFFCISFCMIACIIKVVNYIIFFDMQEGLFAQGFTHSMFNIIFYVAIAVIITLSLTMTFATVPYYKHTKSPKPLIVGYALFFAAVLFVVQGLLGFYAHFVDFIDNRDLLVGLDFLEYIPFILPFITDLFCTLCAFSFYQMAMDCFREDDEPAKNIKSSIIPAFWGVFTLLQIVLQTTNRLFIQPDIEQILFCILNVLFLYYIVKEYYFATDKLAKSTFSIFIEIAFAFICIAVILPYLILMPFGIKDTLPSMPYFAVLGISVYSIVSALSYLFTASALQIRGK